MDAGRAAEAARGPQTRILGIDPGYERCGYAIVDSGQSGRGQALLASGVLRTPAADLFHQRLVQLGADLATLIALWKPEALAIEELYFNRNVKTAIRVAEARGVIIERCARAGLTVAEYSPTAVKSQLTGSGRADKQQVTFMVRKMVAMPADAVIDDEADAVAVALCHGMLHGSPLARRPRGRSDWAALAALKGGGGGR